MQRQIMKGVRLPKPLISRIEKVAASDGSTFSQFVRTAAIEKLNRRKRVA